MKKIILLYWPKEGNVEKSAKKIYQQFDSSEIDIFSVDDFNVDTLDDYEIIIMGNSTTGAQNWEDADNDNKWSRFFRKIEEHDLSNRKIALFGLGNQVLYPAHFVDGLGILAHEVDIVKGKLIGKWPTKGYTFTDSKGKEGDMFFGLALDADNQKHLTDQRVSEWTEMIKKEF